VLGPEVRRGVTDLDGAGEAVSGIIIMRQGENALDVIGRVKAKLREVEAGLPDGVKVVPIYDRSDLIRKSIDNVHLDARRDHDHGGRRDSPVPVARAERGDPDRHHSARRARRVRAVPDGGRHREHHVARRIAIAVGALVDASIVIVEQTHKKLERLAGERRRRRSPGRRPRRP